MSRQHLDYKPPKSIDDRDFVLDGGVVKKGTSVLYRLGNAADNTNLAYYKLNVSQVDDQGNRSACTSFAVSTMYEQLMGTQVVQLSPMFNYTNSRILDGDELDEDPGTTLQTACGNLRLAGICRETTWPYTQANFSVRPSNKAYDEASVLASSIDYVSLARTLSNIKLAIGTYGYLVSIGFVVGSKYESAETTSTGNIQMEDFATMTVIGGHALNLCGWDDANQRFIVVNNYSSSWGDVGYGTIPYDYVMSTDLTPEIKTFVPKESFQIQLSYFLRYTESPQSESGSRPPLLIQGSNDRVHFIVLFLIAFFILTIAFIYYGPTSIILLMSTFLFGYMLNFVLERNHT